MESYQGDNLDLLLSMLEEEELLDAMIDGDDINEQPLLLETQNSAKQQNQPLEKVSFSEALDHSHCISRDLAPTSYFL